MTTGKSAVTPMMAQYLEIKSRYPDAMLFYRMGDFYELFFDDAVAAAKALDIALTKRGKHLGEDIAMCGVPVHSAEGYLLTLIRKGFRVGVCEQLEDPAEAKKRGSKAVVKRDVVRLVTPGTLTEDTLLDARRHNYLASFADVRGESALAWVDISTGALQVMLLDGAQLRTELARLAPSELLIAEEADDIRALEDDLSLSLTILGRAGFDSAGADLRLCDHFGISTTDAWGSFTRVEISALGSILQYLEITQRGKLPLLQPPSQQLRGGFVQIDAATRRNLELTQTMSGARAGSLRSVIDRTVTAGGGRLLENRLSSPSSDLPEILSRLDAVEFFNVNATLADQTREHLRQVPDLHRALSRLGIDRDGPRDLAAIRNGLAEAEILHELTQQTDLPDRLSAHAAALTGHSELVDLLDQALIDEPPLLSRDGGYIAEGYDAELDEARQMRDNGRAVIAKLQADYATQTEIGSLKIKHNNVLGYFIEVTATHADKMLSGPLNEVFKHRQTTANQLRFTTPELTELETQILNAGGRAIDIEKRLYSTLKSAILDQSAIITQAATALDEFDLSAGLADLARAENWCRPLVDDSRVLMIKNGRHPVVEHALKQEAQSFVSNSCYLGEDHDIWLLTGPNMAGKSTFLRQNAIIALLAQMGSYVPASQAHIGLISQLYSRVGASDDLARGRSTFMVEMVETAAILNRANERALVILDEIGRGTATYDGLSIAWATLEHLHEVNKCRALFATHYHELTRLTDQLPKLDNATVTIREHEGDIIFLHSVEQGAADRSYGVQVAKLAGLPPAVVERARIVLEILEQNERDGAGQKGLVEDLPLFSTTPTQSAPSNGPSKIETRLKEVFPDNLSPKEALDMLYELKEMLE